MVAAELFPAKSKQKHVNLEHVPNSTPLRKWKNSLEPLRTTHTGNHTFNSNFIMVR